MRKIYPIITMKQVLSLLLINKLCYFNFSGGGPRDMYLQGVLIQKSVKWEQSGRFSKKNKHFCKLVVRVKVKQRFLQPVTDKAPSFGWCCMTSYFNKFKSQIEDSNFYTVP